MSSSFPTALPGAKTDYDNTDLVASADPNALAEDINAIGAKVGKDSSAVTTSHSYKLSGVTGTDKAVSKAGAETLTNKTLTNPTITTGTFSSPTGIVKGDVGLGNVDNTSDTTKNAAEVTLTNKTITTPLGVVKGDVGLGNVDNTSDATKNAAEVTLTNKTLTAPIINGTVTGTGLDYLEPASLTFVIDGGGNVLTTGIAGDLEIPFDCTITRATALADQSGSVVVDIWKQAYADYPPENANTITAAAPVTITTATKSQDSTLTDWTTAITAGDTLRFNVDSVTSITRVTISLKVTKI